MRTKQARAQPARLERVQRRFERWRRTRKALAHPRAVVGRSGEGGKRVGDFPYRQDTAGQLPRAEETDGRKPLPFRLSLREVRSLRFSNWPRRHGAALANARLSWRTPLGRRCAFLFRALRHPTWQH